MEKGYTIYDLAYKFHRNRTTILRVLKLSGNNKNTVSGQTGKKKLYNQKAYNYLLHYYKVDVGHYTQANNKKVSSKFAGKNRIITILEGQLDQNHKELDRMYKVNADLRQLLLYEQELRANLQNKIKNNQLISAETPKSQTKADIRPKHWWQKVFRH